ncbi:MAG TPA: ribonuclease H-like domain-containing protein [Candidatus Thermoplasmatota archaeon]|nr:ribonuclease H-like domain-containing protein [Candidatus Thermoplasmatota archaeon]
MLEHTFLFLPRVGAKREGKLWESGIRSWEDYRGSDPGGIKGIPRALKREHDALLHHARHALTRDPGFFASVLPGGEQWRAFGDYGRDAVYLDIETSDEGGRPIITVVGLHGPRGTTLLVHDDDLTRENVEEALADASLVVTFNGGSFDLPMLQRAGVRIPNIPHMDLLHACRRLDLRGGLKRIERQLGLGRPEEAEGLTGHDAVFLWHRHRCGESGALEKLLAYNRADVENMVPLANHVYRHLRARTLEATEGPAGPRYRNRALAVQDT